MRPRDDHDLGRFLASVVAFVTLLIVMPVGLVVVSRARFGSPNPMSGVDPPWRWFGDSGRSLSEPIADDTFLDGLIRVSICVIWVAIGVILVTTVLEVIHQLRHRGLPIPDIRGLGWAQRCARFIAVGLLVVLPAVATSPSIAASLPGNPASRAVAPLVDRPTDAAPLPTAHEPIVDESAATSAHVVRPGESVYSIAEQLAAGTRHSTIDIADAILDANLGTVVGPGERFTNPAYLQVGWVLQIPSTFVGHADAVGVGRSPAVEAPNVETPNDEVPVAAPAEVLADDGTYEVQMGDTLWDIADEELGDPTEWRDIWELNAGDDMGGGRTFDDPNLILPGWELDVPDTGDGVDTDHRVDTVDVAPDDALAVPHPTDAPPISVNTVPHPDTNATENATEPPAASDATEGDERAEPDAPPISVNDAPPISVNAVPHPDTNATENTTEPAAASDATGGDAQPDPSAVPIFDMSAPLPPAPPTTGAPAVADVSTSTSTTSPAGASPGSDGEAGNQIERSAPDAPSPIRLEHAALLAAGILALVGVRRRQRLRAARPRHRVPEPRPEVVDTERRLRAVDAGERALRVDVACRAAAWSLTDTGVQVGWVEVSTDGDVELRLTGSATLPAPWAGADQSWRLGAEVPIELLSESARQVGMPCVAFVQVGVTPSGGEVLADLEACGTLAVEAAPKQADEVITAIAAGLASSLYAEVAHLIGVSLPEAALLGHRNAHVVESPDAAFELAAALVGTTVVNDRSTFALRSLRTGGEMWEPAIVLLTATDDAIEVVRSRPLPDAGHGIGIVVASDPGAIVDAPTRIVAESDGWRFDGFGASLEFTPIGLSALDLAAVDEVLADADRELESMELSAASDVQWEGDGAAATDVASDAVTGDGSPFSPVHHEVVVGLLGGVEIVDRDGNPGQFERSKTIELIAWLVTHRERATRTGARTALWEMNVRHATFANVVSEARRGLARLVAPPAGEEWVARTLTDQLPIHDAVVTDAQLVEERLEHARLQPPTQAIETLRPAVALIRDMPFAGTSYLWPDAEGITSNLVLLAITAATEFAGHALSLGDTDGVFWATGQGLKVLPGHEELIGLRMQAHARSGDLAGVRNEWEAYERVLVADTWSDGEPAPKLLALRRELLSL